jgi:hypothetical protein
MHQVPDLALQRFGKLPVAVTDDRYRDAGEEVYILFIVLVVKIAAVSFYKADGLPVAVVLEQVIFVFVNDAFQFFGAHM